MIVVNPMSNQPPVSPPQGSSSSSSLIYDAALKGAVTYTILSPLDRVKYLLQCRNLLMEAQQYYSHQKEANSPSSSFGGHHLHHNHQHQPSTPFAEHEFHKAVQWLHEMAATSAAAAANAEGRTKGGGGGVNSVITGSSSSSSQIGAGGGCHNAQPLSLSSWRSFLYRGAGFNAASSVSVLVASHWINQRVEARQAKREMVGLPPNFGFGSSPFGGGPPFSGGPVGFGGGPQGGHFPPGVIFPRGGPPPSGALGGEGGGGMSQPPPPFVVGVPSSSWGNEHQNQDQDQLQQKFGFENTDNSCSGSSNPAASNIKTWNMGPFHGSFRAGRISPSDEQQESQQQQQHDSNVIFGGPTTGGFGNTGSGGFGGGGGGGGQPPPFFFPSSGGGGGAGGPLPPPSFLIQQPMMSTTRSRRSFFNGDALVAAAALTLATYPLDLVKFRLMTDIPLSLGGAVHQSHHHHHHPQYYYRDTFGWHAVTSALTGGTNTSCTTGGTGGASSNNTTAGALGFRNNLFALHRGMGAGLLLALLYRLTILSLMPFPEVPFPSSGNFGGGGNFANFGNGGMMSMTTSPSEAQLQHQSSTSSGRAKTFYKEWIVPFMAAATVYPLETLRYRWMLLHTPLYPEAAFPTTKSAASGFLPSLLGIQKTGGAAKSIRFTSFVTNTIKTHGWSGLWHGCAFTAVRWVVLLQAGKLTVTKKNSITI